MCTISVEKKLTRATIDLCYYIVLICLFYYLFLNKYSINFMDTKMLTKYIFHYHINVMKCFKRSFPCSGYILII